MEKLVYAKGIREGFNGIQVGSKKSVNKVALKDQNSLIVLSNIRSMGHFCQQRRIMWFICSEQCHLLGPKGKTVGRQWCQYLQVSKIMLLCNPKTP